MNVLHSLEQMIFLIWREKTNIQSHVRGHGPISVANSDSSFEPYNNRLPVIIRIC